MELLSRVLLEPQYFLLTAVIALISAWIVKNLISQPKNLPPGPTGLPVLGVLMELVRNSSNLLRLFSSWADEYGEIISFKLGPKLVVLLNSYNVITEAFLHPDLHNRLKSQMVKEIIGAVNNGVTSADGEVWKEHRKFIHSVFRQLGVGNKSYEDTVKTEMGQLTAAIEEKKGSPFDPNVLLGQAASNIICSIVFGTQYSYDDADFRQLLNMMNTFMRNSGGGGAIWLLPLPGISKIPFGVPKLMANIIRDFNAFVMTQIEAHEKTIDPENPRDYIDRYLNRMTEIKGTDSTFDRLSMNVSIVDLFIAGSETTSTTLTWAILFMMAYPDVQSRVQVELDQVIGRDRTAKLDDRADLPYTNAVLMEIQRKGSIAPLGLPHVAAADVTLEGYTIPKGAILLANIWKVLNSEAHWKDSDAFKPERFLDQDGKLIKREELIFFSTGRRSCLGEQLARMEVFLGFTSLLHRFTFKKPVDTPPLSLQGVTGMTRNTTPYLTCAIPRD